MATWGLLLSLPVSHSFISWIEQLSRETILIARHVLLTVRCLPSMRDPNIPLCLRVQQSLPENISLACLREKAVAPHSSTLPWQIPWTEEPGGLQSMGSLRVRHDWATSLSLFTFMHWRRKWQPTPVFLTRESQGRGSLVGCCIWDHTESDTTEVT